jgi:hypothetical protein
LLAEAEAAATPDQAGSGTLPPSLDRRGASGFGTLPRKARWAALNKERKRDMTNEIALPKNLRDVVDEYDQKLAATADAVKAFESAGDALKSAATIAGVWADVRIDTGHVYDRQVKESLLKSAWKHVYDGLSIERIASAADKRRWQQSLASPAPFTIDNIRATFGDFIINPRINILRGLAEVFCDLDPAYKPHDKVKIGVRGLPKRIIISIGSGYGWGKDRLENILTL